MAGASLSSVFAKTLSSSSLTFLSLYIYISVYTFSSSSSLQKGKHYYKIFPANPKSQKLQRKQKKKRRGQKIYNLETPLLQLFTSFFHIWPALQYTPFFSFFNIWPALHTLFVGRENFVLHRSLSSKKKVGLLRILK